MAKKSSKTKAVVNYASPREALVQLETRLSELSTIENAQWKTSKRFPVQGGYFDISNPSSLGENPVETLITIGAQLIRAASDHNSAAESIFGLKDYPVFKLAGSDVESWGHDLKLAMDIITSETDRRDLKEAIERTRQYITKEESEKMHMENLAERFGIGVK